jgi:hypothetical protein
VNGTPWSPQQFVFSYVLSVLIFCLALGRAINVEQVKNKYVYDTIKAHVSCKYRGQEMMGHTPLIFRSLVLFFDFCKPSGEQYPVDFEPWPVDWWPEDWEQRRFNFRGTHFLKQLLPRLEMVSRTGIKDRYGAFSLSVSLKLSPSPSPR